MRCRDTASSATLKNDGLNAYMCNLNHVIIGKAV
jgi:hypothetical protein